MKLKPEERKAMAKELLDVVTEFEEKTVAVALKYGGNAAGVLEIIDLGDVKQALEQELARP